MYSFRVKLVCALAFVITLCLQHRIVSATPFLRQTYIPSGVGVAPLLQGLGDEDTSHISDFTKLPKANSSAELEEIDKEPPRYPNIQNFEKLAQRIGGLIQRAPEELQKFIQRVSGPKTTTTEATVPVGSARLIARKSAQLLAESESGDGVVSDSENVTELEDDSTNGLTTTTEFVGLDFDDLDDDDDEDDDLDSHPENAPPSSTNLLFTVFSNTVRNGVDMLRAKFQPQAVSSASTTPHPDKLEEPTPLSNNFLSAMDNFLSYFTPIITKLNNRLEPAQATQQHRRRKRSVRDEDREKFYGLIERNVLDRFRFDSRVQALQGKIIFREAFLRFAQIDLSKELSQQMILESVEFFKNMQRFAQSKANETTANNNGSDDGNDEDDEANELTGGAVDKTDNEQAVGEEEEEDMKEENRPSSNQSQQSRALLKSILGNDDGLEQRMDGESIFILFVEILGSVAGLAWGTFSQIMWLLNNMN